MAAEESSQGSPLGPENSEPAGGDPPAERDYPDLDDVLGEFMEALCVLEMVQHVLEDLPMEECVGRVGACAIALRHSFQMLDAVYTRFDEGLLGYNTSGGDDDPDEEPDDEPDDEDDNEDAAQPNDANRGAVRARTSGKQNRLALVA
jgi:hypothetical protein